MANTTQIAVDVPEHTYLNEAVVNPTIALTKEPNKPVKTATIIGLIISLGIFALFSIVPILELYIGNRYAEQCPVSFRIPQYLIVAGVISLIVIVLGVIQSVVAYKMAVDIITAGDTRNQTDPTAKIIGGGIVTCFITFTFSLLLLFLFIWFIFGCYWVFSRWNIVRYDDPNHNNYCHPLLYRFTFCILFISLVFKFISCVRSHKRRSSP